MLTIEDFERLPSGMAENHELVDGELVYASGNTPAHNLLRGRLFVSLLNWADDRHSGMVICGQGYDFLGNAYGPDVSFFGTEKHHLLEMHKRVQRFVPGLAVEIASESDTYVGMLRKKGRYLRAGTHEAWLISSSSPEITIYFGAEARILQSGDTLSSDLLPGFNITLDELFSGLTTED